MDPSLTQPETFTNLIHFIIITLRLTGDKKDPQTGIKFPVAATPLLLCGVGKSTEIPRDLLGPKLPSIAFVYNSVRMAHVFWFWSFRSMTQFIMFSLQRWYAGGIP